MYEYRAMSEEPSEERWSAETEKRAVYMGDSPVPVGSRITYHEGIAPEGSVYISNDEVLQMQHKLIQDWKPRREVWPLTHGAGVIGGLSIVSGAFCNTFFRQRMKLFNYNRIITLISSSILPAMTAVVFQTGFVMKPILLRDYDCPMCIQLRAAAGQMAVTGIQTPVLSFAACASVATLGFRYSFPPMSDFRAWSKSVYRLTRTFGFPLLCLTLFNGYLASLIAYKQQKAAVLVQDKLMGGLQNTNSQEEESAQQEELEDH